MHEEYEKIKEAALDMMETDPSPEALWGEDLAIALVAWYESTDQATKEIPGFHRSQCMSFFELGRRYERRWPQQIAGMEATPVEKILAGLEAPTPEQICATLQAREAFAIQYGKDHEWDEDCSKWDIRQILEVREQPEWKEPKI